jgi:hypothetical protein
MGAELVYVTRIALIQTGTFELVTLSTPLATEVDGHFSLFLFFFLQVRDNGLHTKHSARSCGSIPWIWSCSTSLAWQAVQQ